MWLVRTLGATVALVVAFVALWYAYQDLLGKPLGGVDRVGLQNRSGLVKLSFGVLEAAACVALLILAVRLIGAKYQRSAATT